MKEKYIELMSKALAAYTDEHIASYFERVKTEGLTEHGFPRLTANIGILISHGYRPDLLPLFLEMMEFCCSNFHKGKAANDFSVKEIIFCIMELQKSGTVAASDIARWNAYLSQLDPYVCYDKYARAPEDRVRNWVLFTGVSEYMRGYVGLADTEEFVELQLTSQMKWMDENGMYMDADVHPPMVYDLVPRGLFAIMNHFGYRGRYYDVIDGCLKKAGLLTLDMQSVNGEIPYGGRSNQFIHNEAHLAIVFEYEANRYAVEGNAELASRFKAATANAVSNAEEWLSKNPIRHIKNRFPTETKYGCEGYAYFDKYMITAASFFYAAYLICDDSIIAEKKDAPPAVCRTSEHFHKLFARGRNYFLEFDTNADTHYDAVGLGRIHRKGAPSAICMSVPCPSEPKYVVGEEHTTALSLCSGIIRDGSLCFAADGESVYKVLSLAHDEASAQVELVCRHPGGSLVTEKYEITDDGIDVELSGDGVVAFLLPAFWFDGEKYSEIDRKDGELSISYEDWVCRYTTNGLINGTERTAYNRNGHYHVYYATAENNLSVRIEIYKAGH